jgi:hypothetical protein
MYIKHKSLIWLVPTLILVACNNDKETTISQPPQIGVNNQSVQQFTKVPDQDGELTLGVAFPSFVSFDEISTSLQGAKATVVGAKYFYFGGRGTIMPNGDEQNLAQTAEQVKAMLSGLAHSMDERNSSFLKTSGSKITQTAVQSDPMLQGIVKEGLLSVDRMKAFNQVDSKTKVIYSVTLKANRKAFLAIQSQFKDISFFKSPDLVTPPEFMFVEQAYKSFTNKHYSNGGINSQSANLSNYNQLKTIAKERYNVVLGDEK